MSITIDFEGVSDGGGFEPLEAGNYEAVITEAKPGTSAAGNPKLEVTFQIPSHNNRRMWRSYALIPTALWALKADLVALGIEVPDGKFDLDTAELVGQRCVLSVALKPHYKGGSNPDGSPRMDNEIESVMPASADAAFGF